MSLSPRIVGAVLALVVVVALALDSTTRSDSAPRETGREAFDPAAYGAETYPKVVAELTKRAVPLTELAPELEDDPDAAGERYGKRQGSSPYNFVVTGEGEAGKAEGGLLPIEVDGLDDVDVNLQIGPAINGTSLRDAAGFITFNQFVNQVDYADAATALNEQVKRQVLADAGDLEGKKVKFTGAFTFLAPTVVTLTPIELEAS